jgi:hypothetical protein
MRSHLILFSLHFSYKFPMFQGARKLPHPQAVLSLSRDQIVHRKSAYLFDESLKPQHPIQLSQLDS